MKKILLSLLIIASFTLAANAQVNDTSMHHKMHSQFKRDHHQKMGMMSQLNFTEDQKSKLKAYNEDYRNQLKALNKNENITVKEFRDKKYALKKERKQQFESILTPEQKTKFKELKLQRQHQHEMMAAKRLDNMKIKLGLSNAQVAQLKTQQKEMRNKLMAIKENENLSRIDEQDQLEALRNERKDSFKKILTTDQYNKMKEMRKDRGRMDWNSTN